ncbi:epoxyqueuosine reductase QueG [Methanomicrobium sp. W14]|uniref:epoxyqueuosine reductase n=1 Tax=Methanomicrobium sp. W14 TaxID=2817839 RepID=UPI001AE8F316|nr:epoxyqueuosine reductase [Methanomicrobium sp. W14]MBP2132503.1 epoxyqueuosine reductase QueG [Methanomicrobium sp. W14]
MTEKLKTVLKEKCREMDIPIFGVASAESWEKPPFRPWIPKDFYPRSVFPEAKSVIVIGLPVHLPVIETTPSVWYRELYGTLNRLLDQYTYRIAEYLNKCGYPSVSVPRDGYTGIDVLLEKPVAFFSHRHAAFLAGLGNFGVNNMLLTPEYGPRVRFGSVFTAACLPPDPLMEEELCCHCMACVRMCPVSALNGGGNYPESLTDKKACAENSARLEKRRLAPCGICIKVCPQGKDRTYYDRKNIVIYDDNNEIRPELKKAWEHVRSYGTK